jgi:hypothetical protein
VKFRVVFAGKSVGAVYFESHDSGLVGLDLARRELDLPNLNPLLVSDRVNSYSCDVDVHLSEEQARESGLFENCNKVIVWVPSKFLNRFTEQIIKSDKDRYTGEIEGVWFSYEVDKQKVIEGWADAGYPLNWECE